MLLLGLLQAIEPFREALPLFRDASARTNQTVSSAKGQSARRKHQIITTALSEKSNYYTCARI